jgi:ribosomal protein L22
MADDKSSSIFGEVTKFKESKDSILSRFEPEQTPSSSEQPDKPAQIDISKLRNRDFLKDPEVREFTHPKAKTAIEQLLSPLKRKLYEKVVKEHGKYVDNQVVKLDGKTYTLQLSKEEQQVLEPSLYLKSYRIKYSPKKAMLFTRMLRGMYLKEAITQCHFSPKKVSRDVGEMLTNGIKSAGGLGLKVDDLKIYQIWVGKDGHFMKRPDFKGRGKTGIITHKYIHVRAILKPSIYRERITEQRKVRRDNRQVYNQLHSKVIRDHPKVQDYKW